MTAVGVASLIIISIHTFASLSLRVLIRSFPYTLNRSLMSSSFLFNIKKKYEGEERERGRECVIVLMACNRPLSELEGTTCKTHVRS